MDTFNRKTEMSQGTTITQLDSLARLSTTLDAMLPMEAKVLNSQHEIPLKHGMHFKRPPNADGRFRKHDEHGFLTNAGFSETMFEGNTKGLPLMSDVEVERFITIPPGGKKTVCVRPIYGLCNSGLYWPLPSCIGEDRDSEKLMVPSWVC